MQRKLILVLSFLMPILCLGAGGDHAGGFHLDGSIENMGIILEDKDGKTSWKLK